MALSANETEPQLLRLLDEFLWVVRRKGIEISTSQAIDAVRAVGEVGWEHKPLVRAALASVVTKNQSEHRTLVREFDTFFSAATKTSNEGVRGGAIAIDAGAIAAGARRWDHAAIEEVLAAMAATNPVLVASVRWLLRTSENASLRYAWLRRAHRQTRADHVFTTDATLGQATQKLLATLRVSVVPAQRQVLSDALTAAVGAEQAARLLRQLDERWQLVHREAREMLGRQVQQLRAAPPETSVAGAVSSSQKIWIHLSEDERSAVRQAVHELASRLLGHARGRQLRARRAAPIDGPRTLQKAAKTGGIPVRLVRRERRRDQPELWFLCDVSDSVQGASSLLLEWITALGRSFLHPRSFVFVRDVTEITSLVASSSAFDVMNRVYAGELMAVHQNSNYAHALETFAHRYGRQLTAHTTLCIFGDGRTNLTATGQGALRALVRQARTTLWLCPEPRDRWGTGDSAMPVYAREVTAALPASTPHELMTAMRSTHARRGGF